MCQSTEDLSEVEVVGNQEVYDASEKIDIDTKFCAISTSLLRSWFPWTDTLGSQLFVLLVLHLFFVAGNKVENRWQNEHSSAFGQASDDSKNQSQVVNKDGCEGDDKQIAEADQEINLVWQHILGFDLSLDWLADEAGAEAHLWCL